MKIENLRFMDLVFWFTVAMFIGWFHGMAYGNPILARDAADTFGGVIDISTFTVDSSGNVTNTVDIISIQAIKANYGSPATDLFGLSGDADGTLTWRNVAYIGALIGLDDLKETSLADPGADQVVFWDDSDTQFEFLIMGTGLTITGNTLDAAAGGNVFETMDAPSGTDPVADSATDILLFAVDSNLTITGDSSLDKLTFAVVDNFLKNTGDTGTGDYTLDSPTFHIDSANNRIGIGTTSPTSQLEVEATSVADIRVEATGANSVSRVILENDANEWRMLIDESDRWALFEGNSSLYRIAVLTNGRVGINNNDPKGILDITGLAEDVGFFLHSTGTGSGSNDGFNVGLEDATLNAFLTQRENADMLFSTNAIERMRIDNNGNVGIGTTTPGGPLEVKTNSSSATRDVIIRNQGTGANAGGGLFFANSTGNAKSGIYFDNDSLSNGRHTLRICVDEVNDSGVVAFANEKITIDGATGNIIINEQGGNYDFRVEGDTQTSLFFVDAGAETVSVHGGLVNSWEKQTLTPSVNYTIVTSSGNFVRIDASASSTNCTSISDGEWDGQEMVIIGVSASFPTTIDDVDVQVELDGNTDETLGNKDVLRLQWSSTDSTWYQVAKTSFG